MVVLALVVDDVAGVILYHVDADGMVGKIEVHVARRPLAWPYARVDVDVGLVGHDGNSRNKMRCRRRLDAPEKAFTDRTTGPTVAANVRFLIAR
jgi:hypothetical protein